MIEIFRGNVHKRANTSARTRQLLDYVHVPCVSFSSEDQYETSSSIVTKRSEKQLNYLSYQSPLKFL